jgi:translocator protein
MTRSFTVADGLAVAGWLALTAAAGGIGSLATVNAPDFYGQLQRPPWAPPAWVFGPVWTTLYALMGVAAWLVWRRRGHSAVGWALSLFGAAAALPRC